MIRHLKDQKPVPIEPTSVFEVVIPSQEDVKAKLLESAEEFWRSDHEQCDRCKLEEQIENYMDSFCYPDLDLKIPFPCRGR